MTTDTSSYSCPPYSCPNLRLLPLRSLRLCVKLKIHARIQRRAKQASDQRVAVNQMLPATGPQPSQIVISLSDRAVPFGEADPEATQFFEAYRVEGGACIWEMF